jgi:predicted PurR-regulated permease PerM
MQSAAAAAIGLIAFGSFVVFVADHFVRPAMIGGSTRLPFVWVLLGILGGVESFGLLGLFLGPALLAVLITLWRELASS